MQNARTPGNSKRHTTAGILNSLFECSSEEAVIEQLLGATKSLTFQDARFYDAIFCPFKKRHFYVLRGATCEYPNVKIGYRILDATLDNESISRKYPVWEAWSSASRNLSEEKKHWIENLQLENQGWLDVPVLSGDRLVGLWALNREEGRQPSTDTKKMILAIASVAALKIVGLRQVRVAKFAHDIAHTSDLPDVTTSMGRALSQIGQAMNAEFIAYFSLDPVRGLLRKVAEVHCESNTNFRLVTDTRDTEYKIGEYLTGINWDNETYRFVPFLPFLEVDQPNLVNTSSLDLHTELGGRVTDSVIYHRINVPGAAPGLLRAINRLDKTGLLLTVAHQRTLEQLSYPFAQVISINDASTRLEALWIAVSSSLQELRLRGLDFNAVGTALKRMELSDVIVTIWREDDTLSEVWSNDTELLSKCRVHVESLNCPGIRAVVQTGVQRVDSLPKEIRALLHPTNATVVYIVPVIEAKSRRAQSELVLSLFLLQVLTANNGMQQIKEATEFWNQRPTLRNALDILGRLIGTLRELQRNRSLLYMAEEAIGIIGHEVRSPASRILSLSEELAQVTRKILMQNPDVHLSSVESIEVNPKGNVSVLKMDRPAQVLKWMSTVHRRLLSHCAGLKRVTDDAIRWARMSGRSLEVHFEPVSLREILLSAADELKNELAAKWFLHLDIADSINKVDHFNADAFLLRILLVNLLDNAIKYSHQRHGSYKSVVSIYVERQTSLIDINVTNWGFGIEESDYENIFESFYRSALRDRVHTVRGVGLGLPTCAKIVKVHNGDIKVKSVSTLDDPERRRAMEGFLTTFTVRLPTNMPQGVFNIDMSGQQKH